MWPISSLPAADAAGPGQGAGGSCGRRASSTSGSRIWSGAGRCTSGPCWSGSARTGWTWRTSAGAEDATGATADAIRGGAGVVYQGTLAGEGDGGSAVRAARFPGAGGPAVRRPDGEPRPAGIHYEVVGRPSWRGPRRPAPCCRPCSTRSFSPTCNRSRRGGCTWRSATGSSLRSRWTNFAAYERQTRRLLETAIGGDPAAIGGDPAAIGGDPAAESTRSRWSTAPSAGWRDMCRERRRTDDDLSLVAGMTTGQRRALKGRRGSRPGAGSPDGPTCRGWTG